ncbi:MAG: HD domain-containing protein [bacterium]|nr:HD domain-containing protein [bacterium]
MRFDLPGPLLHLLAVIRDAAGRPLLVGGAVRDAALGRPAKDWDVEVYGLAAEALDGVLRQVGKVHSVGVSFGVHKVTIGGELEIDVALPRRESKRGRGHRGFLVDSDPSMTPGEASLRRDFTLNALAYDPESDRILDFHDGLGDLERRRLRHVGPEFAEDPLRVLRGMQFAGRFRLTAAPETVELSRGLFEEYDTLASERIWIEWFKWAARSEAPSLGLDFLRACDWWDAYPQLPPLAECDQEPEWHPEGNVWRHTLHVADAAAGVAEREGLDPEDRAVLLLAALCHDLGKPATTSVCEGRIVSPGHATHEESYRCFLERIGCPAARTERIVGLCREHLSHMGFAGSARHVRRLARRLGEHGESIEMLSYLVEADHSGRPPLPGGMPDVMSEIVRTAREHAIADAAPPPLLRGRDLIRMGLVPGPEMGRILRSAYDAQLDGEFDSEEGAREWARGRRAAADPE